MGPVQALQRPSLEPGNPIVEVLAQLRQLLHQRFADARHAPGLHPLIHLARTDTVYVGLLNDCDQGFLAAPPRFEELRVGAGPQLGNGQSNRPDAGVPRPGR